MVYAAPAHTGKEVPLHLLRIEPVPHAKTLEARLATVGAGSIHKIGVSEDCES